MTDVYTRVRRKVSAIFRKLAGGRAKRTGGGVVAYHARRAIIAALSAQYGKRKADAISLHMADWNTDAAFIVALILFPERFKKDEIDAGIRLFLIHAPTHIRMACYLTGEDTWESFPYDVDFKRKGRKRRRKSSM